MPSDEFGDIAMTPADATANVTLGHACSGDDCPSGQGCVDGRCVDIGGDGGLGSSCMGNGDCISNQCASDGTQTVCVEQCNPANRFICLSRVYATRRQRSCAVDPRTLYDLTVRITRSCSASVLRCGSRAASD